MQETKIGYRGSKLPMLGEKEQRVDGSYYCKFLILHSLRYILMGFEKNSQAINLSKQMNIHRTYSKVVSSSSAENIILTLNLSQVWFFY